MCQVRVHGNFQSETDHWDVPMVYHVVEKNRLRLCLCLIQPAIAIVSHTRYETSNAKATLANRYASLAALRYSCACRNFERPDFCSRPPFISRALMCVSSLRDALYQSGRSHKVTLSSIIWWSVWEIKSPYSWAMSRADSNFWSPRFACCDGNIFTKESIIL
jgi:hypothetical protein